MTIRVKVTYKAPLKTISPMMTPKLNEKIMISNEANMETIINANREMGRPKMTARFRIFL